MIPFEYGIYPLTIANVFLGTTWVGSILFAGLVQDFKSYQEVAMGLLKYGTLWGGNA
jgi:hypothetical protein